MSRRWIPRRTEPDTAVQPAAESIEQALVTSITTNRQLRAELDAVEKKLTATEAQLEFHRGQLHETKVALGLKVETVERLERHVGSLAHRLTLERDHTAGSCSHAADLKAMGTQVGALERRVAELQRVNEGYEAPGWLPRMEQAVATRRGRR